VFPSFATTKAELVCNGILPIDQLREFTGPTALVCQRIPRPFLEATYGIRIHVRPLEEGGTGTPTAEELLVAYAVARGYTKTGQGQPDESRAARYILKDYVNGRLRFCHPPPADPPLDPIHFNSDLYSPGVFMVTRAGKRPAVGRGGSSAELAANDLSFGDAPFYPATLASPPPPVQSDKSLKLDRKFFAAERGGSGHLTMPFNYKYTEQGSAELSTRKQLSGRKQREMVALASGVDPSEVGVLGSKKHFKGNKRRVKALGED
jgi:large subunit GTPase 1